MKINEFSNIKQSTPEANLVTALQLIRNRYKNQNKNPKISTQSLINLILNTDKNFDYDALVDANENNPAVKNLIKSFNKDYIELRSDSDETAPTTNVGDETTLGSADTVDNMARRAAKKRDSSLF